MVFALEYRHRKIRLRDKLVLGRRDFAGDKNLSRRHLEISIRPEGLYVRDLGSSNGSALNGQTLARDVYKLMREGDSLRVGKTILTLVTIDPTQFDPYKTRRISFALCFLFMSAVTLLRPSMGYGRALSFFGLAITFGIILVAVGISAEAWYLLLRRKMWSTRQVSSHYALVLLTSALGSLGILFALDWVGSIHENLIQTKIEYFCASHFDHYQCVYNVNLCPDCALHLDRWKRTIMLEKLKASNDHFQKLVDEANEVKLRKPAAR